MKRTTIRIIIDKTVTHILKVTIFKAINRIKLMEIHHDVENRRAWTEKDGLVSEVEYELTDTSIDIVHTYVPAPLEGKGIASQLVKFVYDYALKQELKPAATCSYAQAWLERHPEYHK